MINIRGSRHVLAVHDLEKSVRYYSQELGFIVLSEHPGWVFLGRDAFVVMLGECKDALAPTMLGDHAYFAYIDISGIAGLFKELSARRVTVSKPLTEEPWGMTEFGIETIDGHRIMFGEET